MIDKKNKIPRDVYERELIALGLSEEQIQKIDSLYTMSVDEAIALCPASQGAEELRLLFSALRATGMDKYCVFDFGIIRGLDYYTGTVFEVFDNAPENNRAMFGGGRYDNLVGLFVNNAKISGVGYGMGDVTLENFLVTHNLIPENLGGEQKVLVTRFSDVPFERYLMLANRLRDAGVTATVYLGTKKFGKQLDYAVKDGFTHIVTVGGDELERGVARIKDLATREETEVALDAVESYFGA